jgi:hypothetical protein
MDTKMLNIDTTACNFTNLVQYLNVIFDSMTNRVELLHFVISGGYIQNAARATRQKSQLTILLDLELHNIKITETTPHY